MTLDEFMDLPTWMFTTSGVGLIYGEEDLVKVLGDENGPT